MMKDNYFKVESKEDGFAVSADGTSVYVKSMVALAIANLFHDKADDNFDIDVFIAMLKNAYDYKMFFKILNSTLTLYDRDENEGLQALSMAAKTAVEVYNKKKEKEEDEKGGPVA